MTTKARIAHFSLLLNKYKDGVEIGHVREQLRVLLIAPGNERSNSLNKVIVRKTVEIAKEADLLIGLLSESL